MGIIGTNGSGKSTILKIITGVLTPTSGQVEVEGKISALLELGAGFNMDYTGIENVYMNGTMMGYTKKEMDAKLQDILDFAEIGDFVYQPVKNLFQRYVCAPGLCPGHQCGPGNSHCGRGLVCGGRIFSSPNATGRWRRYARGEPTILMVTHDMGSIIKYCDKVVLLNKGEFIAEGPPGRVVDMYKKILAGKLAELKAELAEEKQREAGCVELSDFSRRHGPGRDAGRRSFRCRGRRRGRRRRRAWRRKVPHEGSHGHQSGPDGVRGWPGGDI